MKMFLNISIAFLFILFIMTQNVHSFNIPADSDEISRLKPDKTGSISTQASQDETSSSRGHSQAGVFTQGIDVPVQLIKEISPDGNYSHLVNTTLRVRVEVLLTGKELKNIQILESVDPSLKVSNISKIYTINNLLELPRIERGFEDPRRLDELTEGIPAQTIVRSIKCYNNITSEFNNDYLYLQKYNISDNNSLDSLLYYNDNIFYIEKTNIDDEKAGSNNIGKKGRLIFWYDVMPKYPGIYNTRTIVRTNDEYQDLDQITKINVLDPYPQFDVSISGTKTELGCGENLNITYNIIYRGGSVNPFNCDISIRNDSDDYTVVGGKSYYSNISFRLNELNPIYFNVNYPSAGKFFLPDLSIHGKSIYGKPNEYTFKGNVIDVIALHERYANLINWFIFGFLIMLSQIFCVELNFRAKSFIKTIKCIRRCDGFINCMRIYILKPASDLLKRLLKYERK